jgi:MFS family permease
VVGFSLGQVAIFIAVLCVTSVLAQTAGLTLLVSLVGNKYCIIVGLFLQAIQLVIYGIWTSTWLMWVAGMLAASASIIYPAISAMVSKNAEPEQQGVVLGILTGWLYTV